MVAESERSELAATETGNPFFLCILSDGRVESKMGKVWLRRASGASSSDSQREMGQGLVADSERSELAATEMKP